MYEYLLEQIFLLQFLMEHISFENSVPYILHYFKMYFKDNSLNEHN